MATTKKRKMSSITLWLSIATAAIAILSAIFSQIEKDKEKTEALAKEQELNQKNIEIIESQKKLLLLQKESKDSQAEYSNQIISLQNQLQEKQTSLQERTEEVAKLQQENIKEVKSIYDINRTIKYPMPGKIELSYLIIFQLDGKTKIEFENVYNAHSSVKEKTTDIYFPINETLLKEQLDWKNYMSEQIKIYFAQKFEASKTRFSANALFSFSNSKAFTNYYYYKKKNANEAFLDKSLGYNPIKKEFILSIKDVALERDLTGFSVLTPNLNGESIFDLNNSIFILNQPLPESFKQVHIVDIKIASKELNLSFPKLENTESPEIFVDNIKVEPRNK